MSAIARPFGMILMLLYELVGNYGVAIILFAIIIRIILLPFQMKGKRGSMRMSRLQPKIKEIQEKHGTNKAKVNEETMKLYKQEGVSPSSGCLWNFLPLPIMFALFMVINQPITIMMGVAPEYLLEGGALYNQLQYLGYYMNGGRHGQIGQAMFIYDHYAQFAQLGIEGLRAVNFTSFGIDLGRIPQWNFLWSPDTEYSSWFAGFILFMIPLISGALQMLHTRVNQKLAPMPGADGQPGMGKMMMLMPLFSVYIGFVTPGALGLYWTMGTALMLVQDIWLTKHYTKIIDAEEAVRNEARKKKEAELEAKRLETERKKAEGLVEQNPNTSKRKKKGTEKQEQIEKAAEWQKKNDPQEEKPEDPAREGNRRFARGRAYDPERYGEQAPTPVAAAAGAAETATDAKDSSRVGDRPFARGRAYSADRDDAADEQEEPDEADNTPEDVHDEPEPETVEESEETAEAVTEAPDGGENTAETTRFETTRFDSPDED